MKVLRSGANLYAQKCNCGCIFAYSKNETKYVQTGIQEYEYAIKCPECGVENFVYFKTKERYERGFKNCRGDCKNNNIKLVIIPYWDYDKLNSNYIQETLLK